jgi:hypothetical protein
VTRIKQLTVLLLVPVLLSGCSALGLSSSSTGSSSSSASGSSSGSAGGKTWLVVDQGTPTPSATPGRGASGDSWSLPWTPLGSNGNGGAAATANPTASCGADTYNFSRIAGATVVASATSAVVSWYNVGGSDRLQFRLTAISQDLVDGKQRDVGWVTITPTGCGPVSATITGLDRKTGYVFSVDAVALRHSGDGTHAETIARSGVVRTQ